MLPLDRHYLSLQFKDHVHRKSATEFQSFFEEIMGTALKDFRKIRPYGPEGDRGNDGYIPDKGVYYQVYSPKEPGEKEAEAARKFKNDFNTLKNHWDKITNIKEYHFVFNDKYGGVTIELERARAELKRDNPNIEFRLFLPKDLEDIFFTLNPEELVLLGFNVDSRHALRMAREYLDKLEIELDRGNAGFVLKTLESIRNIFIDQNDESLALDYEILECKAWQKVERIVEARDKYQSLLKRYPKDARVPLLLAEIHLNSEDYDKNLELLKLAETIDPMHWMLPLQKLLREYRLRNKIDVSQIDENRFPSDPRIKAEYYRIYSLFLEHSGERERAESFIERSIQLNPEKLASYYVRLSSQLDNMFFGNVEGLIESEGQILLSKLEDLRRKFADLGGPGIRNNILLNMQKLRILLAQENGPMRVEITKETFELGLRCYFDQVMDAVFAELVRFVVFSAEDFSVLLDYLQKVENTISDQFARMLILQFMYQNTLPTEGNAFFKKIGKEGFAQFIKNLLDENYDAVWKFVESDLGYAVSLFFAAKKFPGLRKKIIENLPDDGTIQKGKLGLLLNYEEENIDEAFALLKNLDLSNFSYAECKPALDVAVKKKAWDFVIVLLDKLLKSERDQRNSIQIKLNLFSANLNLERFPEATRIGEALLEDTGAMNLVDDQDKELLLTQTVIARVRRGEYPDAGRLIKNHASLLKTFPSKALAAEVYLKNNDAVSALSSVVDGIKILKRPSAEEYGSLFFIFTQIGNLMEFHLVAEKEVTCETFVKLTGEEEWYFVGIGDELDAIKIPAGRLDAFLKKKVGETVILGNPYSSERKERQIENILPTEKYILWQSRNNAEKLSKDRLWDTMEIIEVPQTDTGIDPKYLNARLEDQHKRGQNFFEIYCTQNVPLALLAVSEGGLTEAIGRIMNEGRGFIKATSGIVQEINEQKTVAKDILSGATYYIDGTSALILSQTDKLEKICKFLPNIKIPQSVITLLLGVVDRFRYMPGQAGHMRYSRGKIQVSPLDPEQNRRFQDNFEKNIKFLESKTVEVISSANKSTVFSEQNVYPYLADACVLARREKVSVLTEDFLYLQFNELETKEKAPRYCSIFTVIRILYESQMIDFDEYLNFFAYLSSYRFRFLGISVEDLEKALLGDAEVKTIRVEELRKFNLPMTLSEEYGVPPRMAFTLVAQFLIRLLNDDSILRHTAERAFVEIVSTFPTTQDRKDFATTLLIVCVRVINKTPIIGTKIQEKIDLLSQLIRTLHSTTLISPND